MVLTCLHPNLSSNCSEPYRKWKAAHQLYEAVAKIAAIAGWTPSVEGRNRTGIVGARLKDDPQLNGSLHSFDVAKHATEGQEHGALDFGLHWHAIGYAYDAAFRPEFRCQHSRGVLISAMGGKAMDRGHYEMAASLVIE